MGPHLCSLRFQVARGEEVCLGSMRWQNQDQNPGLQTLSTEAQSSLWVPGGPESSLVSDTHGTEG